MCSKLNCAHGACQPVSCGRIGGLFLFGWEERGGQNIENSQTDLSNFACGCPAVMRCSVQPQANNAARPRRQKRSARKPERKKTRRAAQRGLNSDISGESDGGRKTDQKDDFNAAVNQEWIAGTDLARKCRRHTFTGSRSNEVMAQGRQRSSQTSRRRPPEPLIAGIL